MKKLLYILLLLSTYSVVGQSIRLDQFPPIGNNMVYGTNGSGVRVAIPIASLGGGGSGTTTNPLSFSYPLVSTGSFNGSVGRMLGIDSTYWQTRFVRLDGSYSNPSFLTSLAFSKITGTPTSLSGYGITDPVVLTSGSYANPSWITSLAYSKITGAPTLATVATSGDYNDLINKPTIPAAYTDAQARGAISETITGVDYNSSTGVFSQTAGYFIPQTVNLSGTNTGDQYGNATSSTALQVLRRNAANTGYEFATVPAGDTTYSYSKAGTNSLIATREPTITPGTTAQYLRGDKTFFNFGTSTRNSSVAQSLSLSNTAIVGTDSVAVAFGKAQGQINANAAAIATNTTKVSNNATNNAKNQIGVYSVRDTITQSAHGFSANQVVRKAGTWKLAQANNAANAEALGIIESATTNTFVVVYAGKITLSGLTADSTYFLSPTTPGLLTLTPPSANGQVSKPILRSYSSTSGQVINMRGISINAPSSQVSSFNARTGAVTSQSGDYPASLIPLVTFSSGAGSVSSSDNVLQAIQKLDGNISANTSTLTSLTPTNVLSSAGTLALVPVANAIAWYTFSGTTTTWTLPVISGNTGATFAIKNRGSGNITLNSNAGGNDIYTSSAVSTYSITPGQAIFIHNDSGAWSVE